MLPFLLLATRDHDQAAQAEYASVLRHAGLRADQLVHVRVEAEPLRPLNLADYSGIFLGGSSFNISDVDKSALQQRVEADVASVVAQVIAADFPFLGMCYGVGAITTQLGGVVDRAYGEPVGAIEVELTADGLADPVLAGVGERFSAFVGHKEASHGIPPGVRMLGLGATCPVQMYRVGENVYVTQFHPELDADDLAARMRIYRDAGYFEPAELDELIAMAQASGVDGRQHLVIANFAKRYAREA